MNRHRAQWEKLGSHDPYWAVLTSPEKKGGKWEEAEFFDTGKKEISVVLRKISGFGLTLERGVALDFGCGVGRLSRALANEFNKVLAIDISSSMLQEARRVNHHISNIEFIHNDSHDLAPISSDSIDFLYSNIVLQHIPSKMQSAYIREFCRVLSPGGVLAIQTPSECNLNSWQAWLHFCLGNRVLNVIRRIRYGPYGVMEIHTLPRQSVVEALTQGDTHLIHLERYDSAGPAFRSYRYFAQKISHP